MLFYPYPISVIAPGCEVADDGNGACIRNVDSAIEEPVFTGELLKQTVLDPETGYLSHPTFTCGPYKLTGYDAESGKVDFELNPYYAGNWDGVVSYIDTVTLIPISTQNMIQYLLDGTVDIINKAVDGTGITQCIQELDERFSRLSYARLGYGFVGVACEKGPQHSEKVRQALACMLDADAIVSTYLQNYGMKVMGCYGLGQWMTEVAMGLLRPENLSE